jgi:DNA-binding CsgD family transcriptional regulator
MSLFNERDERIVVATKTRCRDAETMEERDRKVWETLCEGKSLEVTARIFRITPRYVQMIADRLPIHVRRAIRLDVMRRREDRLSELSEVG